MQDRILRNGRIVNRGRIMEGDLRIRGDRIEAIGPALPNPGGVLEVDLHGALVLPGVIDDQVHFREPGMTHKASIGSESRAAVAGGVTSFMEMPNTKPPAITKELLEDKYHIASRDSVANYSFYMGTSNDNLEEVLRTDPARVCGVKIFMGSSTGNMLVDDQRILEELFARCPMLIATHCEDETTIRNNLERYRTEYGSRIPMSAHPLIRSREACLMSSSLAEELARRHGTRLHILHLSTAEEIALFDAETPLAEKRITAEACVHHLHFTDEAYERLGSAIKCNPAIKTIRDKEALWAGLLDNHLDVIATDHAPHTWAEKQGDYESAPSGLPLVQHSLVLMLQYVHEGRLSVERLVEKMCHAPAVCFRIPDRGFLDEGCYADIVVVDPAVRWTVEASGLLYRCGWSPLEGMEMQGRVEQTYVNGHLAYDRGRPVKEVPGRRLAFRPLD